MKLHLHSATTYNAFTGHGAHHVAVNGKRFEHSVVVTPGQVLTDWPPQTFADLEESHFEYLQAVGAEVLILGTGAQLHFPHPRLYRRLAEARISVECMDTAAACRTYNILAAEGRKVVAAVLM